MNQTETLEQTHTAVASDTNTDIQARLKAISEALAAKQAPQAEPQRAAFTCPIDPAERAACDSCQ